MIQLPVLRWGQPYESLEIQEVQHFSTGEPIARVSQANEGIIRRDMRQARNARNRLRQIPSTDLIQMLQRAAELYEQGTLQVGDAQQSPDDFVHQQSASTGLPEHMCRANMSKNSFVLKNMDRILDCLTRGLDLRILTAGLGPGVAWGRGQLPGAGPGAGRRTAIELPRRPHPVVTGHSAATGTGTQARPAGTVDTLPHGGRIHRGRYPAAGVWTLPW